MCARGWSQLAMKFKLVRQRKEDMKEVCEVVYVLSDDRVQVVAIGLSGWSG